MKFLLSIFLVAATLVIGCSNKSSNSLTTESDLKQILEINAEANGSSYVVGKWLFLRLYENGTIEFDHTDNKKIEAKINKAEDVMALEKAKISEQELQQFLNLLNSESFQNTPKEVKRKCCCTDTSLNLEIISKVGNSEKRINLNNFCDVVEIIKRDPRYLDNLPKVLSDLVSVSVKEW